MSQFKNRHLLKKKELRKFLDNLKLQFNVDIDKKSKVEKADFEGIEIIIIDDKVDFFVKEGKTFFTLPAIEKYKPQSNKVVVDMGAVKFISNGADVMAPGIVKADKGIKAGDVVWVCDEKHGKPLVVGEALMDGETMENSSIGKAVKTLHYVGDKLWRICAKSL
ncbi:RNA-binding protein [Euryarchaeota archaeon ex4484_162]|nr:MAG: RNA-binding protein [Euryarchaeota archaeon ex4484_162]